MLKALLATHGIEAHLILVNARPRYRLTEVATANFDYAIAYVPALDTYLDPTASAFAFGALPPGLHGKPILDVDRGTVGTIPPMKANEFLSEARTDYALHPDGRRTAVSSIVGTGMGAALARSVATRLEQGDRTQRARGAIENAQLTGSGTYSFPNTLILGNRYTITAPFEVVTPVDVSGAHEVRMLPLTNPLPHLSAFLTPEAADYACLPLTVHDEASLLLPPGVNVYQRSGPLSHEVALIGETTYGRVSGRVRATHEAWQDGRTVRTKSAFVVSFDAAVCPRAFAEAVREGLTKFDIFQRQAVGLTSRPVGRVTEGGSAYAEGLAAYKQRLYGQALDLWRPAAEAGDAGAQYRVGMLYRDGLGVSRAPTEAHAWFVRAAKGGDADAQIALAHQFESGSGVARDVEQATRRIPRSCSPRRARATATSSARWSARSWPTSPRATDDPATRSGFWASTDRVCAPPSDPPNRNRRAMRAA